MMLLSTEVALDLYKSTVRQSVFSPNTGKYGPEETPYLDTFHAVITTFNQKRFEIITLIN